MYESCSDEYYLKKIVITCVKPIIVGGIIGANFINLVGDNWILLHKNPEICLEIFRLSCDTTPDLSMKINGNIGNTSIFNEENILSTVGFQF